MSREILLLHLNAIFTLVRLKSFELILEINETVIVASHWFLYYLTYIDDAGSNKNQISCVV